MQPTSSITLASSAPALASTVTYLPYQYIEQERVLLFADELIVQPVPLMTNPGSLTMGFVGVDPRQSPYLVSCLLRRAQLSYNRISFGHEQYQARRTPVEYT